RTRPQRVIINDLRIANAPGGVNRYFATVRQVEIAGGVESFWGRHLTLGRIDIRDPRVYFEVFPTGSKLVHNFPKWNSGPPRKRQIVHDELDRLFVTGGQFQYLDRKHDITAVANAIAADVVVRSKDLYEGTMTSPRLNVKLQDYVPFDLDLRGGFRYTPGKLALNSVALRGRGIEAFLAGKLDPLTEGQYDLRLTSKLELERVREIFKVTQILGGTIALDTTLRGKQGDFRLAGGFVSPKIVADVYELANARGKLDVTGEKLLVDVDTARYGGGTIGAHYELAKYAEPYPMTVDLRYDGISIEKLFGDWGVKDTGLRAAATGELSYAWNKDKILEGSGDGTAKLARNAVAFSDAKYPIGISGSTDFSLDRGTITFRNGELDTDKSHVSLAGKMRIENIDMDLRLSIRSDDLSELDRIGYNFAHSADKRDYDLLGLGGAGTIAGSVTGPIKTPQVVAKIVATNTRYNDVVLGASDIDLRYDGVKSVLTFDRATFVDGNGRLALSGTISFPDRGPGPRFDIAVDAVNYPAERAMQAVELDLKIGPGLATGKLLVAGTPESGRVTFAGLTVRREEAELRLRGDVEWLPGEGKVRFDLDIAARDFPVADLITFLDLGPLPVTGNLTGTLNIRGPKEQLEGSGTVTVRNGSIYGEPVDTASADIAFTTGKLRATNVVVRAPAGEITGEAEYDFASERFNYTIKSSSLDLSRLKILESVRDLFGGKLIITSTGAGTMDNPEVVLEATLADATVRGLSLPAGSPPPSIYVAIRGGRLIVRGSIADIVAIE
ncbi:MAG TPA: translocation/assembly module TamB domain-containing protein, partial [Thermoanaerobaculia bacterium]